MGSWERKKCWGATSGLLLYPSLARLLPESSLCSLPTVRLILTATTSVPAIPHHSFWPFCSSLYPSLWDTDCCQPLKVWCRGEQLVCVCRWERRKKWLSLPDPIKDSKSGRTLKTKHGMEVPCKLRILSRGLNEVRMDSHTEMHDKDILGRRNSKHKDLKNFQLHIIQWGWDIMSESEEESWEASSENACRAWVLQNLAGHGPSICISHGLPQEINGADKQGSNMVWLWKAIVCEKQQ